MDPQVFIKDLKIEKTLFFVILNDLLPVPSVFDNILFSMATKMTREDPDPAGSVINWPPGSRPTIQDSGSGSKRTIYRSTTLL